MATVIYMWVAYGCDRTIHHSPPLTATELSAWVLEAMNLLLRYHTALQMQLSGTVPREAASFPNASNPVAPEKSIPPGSFQIPSTSCTLPKPSALLPLQG